MSALAFVVPGEPVGKQRARTFIQHKRDGTPFVTTMTPPKTAAYEKHVATLARIAANRAAWMLSRRDRYTLIVRVWRTHEGAGGDLDNVVKAISDALNGIAYPDDRYVRGIAATMRQDRARPRVEVEVRRVEVRR